MLPIKNGLGATTALATDEVADVHTPLHRDADRAALLALLDGVEGSLASILAKIISAPATEVTLAALLAAIRPATGHALVSPSATALATPSRRVRAGAAGALTMTVGGATVTYTAVAGEVFDVVATHITAAPAGTVVQF